MNQQQRPRAHGLPRVLFVISTLGAGGAERVVTELANVFQSEGYAETGVLTLAASCPDRYQLNESVQRIQLDLLHESKTLYETLRKNIDRSLAIRRAVAGFAPDVVISFVDQNNIRVLAALLGSSVPVVVSERTDPRHHELGRGWNLARQMLYPLARFVVVQTASVARWAAILVPAPRVRVIANFVRDLPAPTGEREPEILGVGRLGHEKGFDLLLEAFARTGLHHRGYRLTLLGEGPERASLEMQAGRLGIRSSLCMPGVVDEPARYMAKCSVFVLPSRYEGFPNVLLEAMAMGCPVIAANCSSGPADIVIPGKNGLLVPSENARALAEALDTLMGDDEMRERLGEGAKEVRECFSRDKIVKQWLDMIHEAVS